MRCGLSSLGIALTLLLLSTALAWAGPHDLVVVRPGGPATGDHADQQVLGLAKALAKSAGWPVDSVHAKYFNQVEPALVYIAAEKPGFVFSTPGFYLQYRQKLDLKPVNRVELAAGADVQYFVLVKKGSATSLADLKGQSLAGAHLTEPEFLDRIVFGDALDLQNDVTTQPLNGLTALRKLRKGEVFAVVIDSKEKASLAALPWAKEFAEVYTSAPIPNSGLMALGNQVGDAEIQAMRQAAAGVCQTPDGQPVCQLMEIRAFSDFDHAVYERLAERWGQGSK